MMKHTTPLSSSLSIADSHRKLMHFIHSSFNTFLSLHSKMGLLQWLLRCTPGLSTLLLLAFIEYTLRIGQNIYHYLHGDLPHWLEIPSPAAQAAFCAYSILIQLVAILFPFRLSWAAWSATKSIREEYLRIQKRQAGLELQGQS